MVLYIPGFSLKNKVELQSIFDALITNGYEVISHEWKHWETGIASFNITRELTLISDKVKNKEVNIAIGKSIGTLVICKFISEFRIAPENLILMGIPLNDISEEEKEIIFNVIESNISKVTLVHNKEDSHASIDQIKTFLKNLSPKIIEKDSNTHEYNYPEDVLSIIKR